MPKEDKYIMPEYYKEMFNTVEEMCQDNNIHCTIQSELQQVLEKGYHE